MAAVSTEGNCPGCGLKRNAGAAGCPSCGYQFGAAAEPGEPPKLCINPRCQAANEPRESHCQRCGELLPAGPGTLLFGRYRLQKALKAGGFGMIYRACDTHNQDRAVVVKEMIVADPREFAVRLKFFVREFEILRLLNEQKLAEVPRYYGFSHDEANRTAHLIMEFIPGRNLLEALEAQGQRPFPLARVVEWGQRLCDVLSVMHSHDPPLIHRDVKPDNIMLQEDDRSIKMIDFGTARELRDRSPLTRVYSEDYAPPEQVLGRPEPRSDLFALAATLYHLASGKVPRGVQTVQDLALASPQIAASDRWFFELIRVNLNVNVEERYPSAQAFREDLEKHCVRERGQNPQDLGVPAEKVAGEGIGATAPAEGRPSPTLRQEPAGATAAKLSPKEPAAAPGRQEGPEAPRRSPYWLIAVVLLGLGVAGIALSIHNGWFSPGEDRQAGPGKDSKKHPGPDGAQKNDHKQKPGLAPVTPRTFTSAHDVWQVIHAHLENTPESLRPFQRYFTLEHLHNNPTISLKDFEQHRVALSDLLRQLNPTGDVTTEGLGEGTVLRLDIRKLGWEQKGSWRIILAAYPYGLTNAAILEIEKRAGSDVPPLVRADWFVAAASQAPLFGKLADGMAGPTARFSEAMNRVKEIYQKDLKVREVALELGLADAGKLQEAVQNNPRLQERLQRLNFGMLMEGGSISRERWTAAGLMTPFQEMAVSLGLGNSLRVQEAD